ncbi:YcgN family cysteine cluster protein [Psychrobacter aquaticus]|uniref:YcgN family cysteine cluster protein n=1 Tax=Psychrobacter aquaticus CMS 56 TaxID=1354303 RepID=U4TEI8_9GAMM|nr:YcgN family cysteine cluster protein [Psychrobacter aquaticus]ERL56883.1 hypothetical protein M917_0080 [Psychrobacter aquaticus CMS 56]
MTINLLNKHDDNSDLYSDHDTSVTPEQSVTLFPEISATSATNALRPQFWSRFALTELNHSEWEALCDGCGSCCLIKYIDEDENGDVDEELVEYTDVTCQLMDCATGYCQHYATRQEHVPDCIQLTINNLPNMMWLPAHCAYKRLYKGQNLPSWHLLLTGDAVKTQQQMRAANVGVAGRCVSETSMSDEEMETRVVNWVKP